MTTPRIGHIFRLAQIIKESCEQCTDQEATSLAKAILEHPGSHWSPTPQPVPTSERLPSAADCDAEGNCWWFDPHADGAWYVDTFQSCYTHWLSANAPPTPIPPMNEPLSPAAQAVLDAVTAELDWDARYHSHTAAAAALRAAADQVVPDEPDYMRAAIHDQGWWDKQDLIRSEILAIAAELDGAQ